MMYKSDGISPLLPVETFLCDITVIALTKEEMLKDEDNWYLLDGSDGLTYRPATIVSILDSIEEYDGFNN